MRILVATPSFAPQVGGAETWTRAVLTALAARGHDVRVVARAHRDIVGRHDVAGIAVTRVTGGRVAFSLGVSRAVRTTSPDVVLAQYAALPAAVMAARRAHTPVIGIVHDVYGWPESRRVKGPIRGTVRWLVLERALRLSPPDRVLVPSHATASRVRQLLPRVPVDVVPAGADHLRRLHARRPVAGRVLFVGRLVHQKGALDVIDAVAALRADGCDARLVVVGRGPQRDLVRERAARLGRAVVFREGVSDDELDELLCTAAALALPSTREGWGLSVTEAAARGTPYVAYDIPAVREQHELLQGGVLVPPRPDALADALRTVLGDPEPAAAAAARAATRAATMTWQRAADVVESALGAVEPRAARR